MYSISSLVEGNEGSHTLQKSFPICLNKEQIIANNTAKNIEGLYKEVISCSKSLVVFSEPQNTSDSQTQELPGQERRCSNTSYQAISTIIELPSVLRTFGGTFYCTTKVIHLSQNIKRR
jgi:hypothetical protein